MCNPTLIFSAARTAFSIVQANQQAKADRLQAQRQNEIAAQARREKENAENLRLRQIREKKLAKIAELQKEAAESRATARAAAETVGGGVLNRVIANYYRTEGIYKSQIERNLEAEATQSDTNKRLFAIEQEGRQVYIPEVDTAGIFAAGAIEFGGDWLEWRTRQLEKEEMKKNQQILFENIFTTG